MKTWLFPDETLVVNDGGIVYNTEGLTYRASLGRKVEDIVFDEGVPIVLFENRLFSYSAVFLETGRFSLTTTPSNIFLFNKVIFAFSAGANEPQVEKIPVNAIQQAVPAPVIDPADGLIYTADHVEIGSDEILYLLHKDLKNIFRWDPTTRQYLPSIALIDTPIGFTYDEVDNSLYIAYPGGRYGPGSITRILLNELFIEHPFANMPWQATDNLTMAGNYLLTGYHLHNNSFVIFSVLNKEGAVISIRNYSDDSSEYVWNAVQGGIYYSD